MGGRLLWSSRLFGGFPVCCSIFLPPSFSPTSRRRRRLVARILLSGTPAGVEAFSVGIFPGPLFPRFCPEIPWIIEHPSPTILICYFDFSRTFPGRGQQRDLISKESPFMTLSSDPVRYTGSLVDDTGARASSSPLREFPPMVSSQSFFFETSPFKC